VGSDYRLNYGIIRNFQCPIPNPQFPNIIKCFNAPLAILVIIKCCPSLPGGAQALVRTIKVSENNASILAYGNPGSVKLI
jgi:hypothetical protein